MSVRHSIVMICYNQEKYIRTALDSVLCERIKPYEIIIGDDASTDGTRRILEEYRAKYPEIIKVILNERNLGISANFNNVAPKAMGDMVHILSGDDWFKPGLLERMNNKILEMNLNPQKSRFILLPHVIHHLLDGSEVLLKNDPRQLERYGPVGSRLRGIEYNNQVGYSRAIFNMWPLFPDDSETIGPWADLLQYVMLAQYIDRQIIMDCEGHVYRAGVGITSRTKREDLMQSYHNALVRIQHEYKCGRLNLNRADSKYLDFHEKSTQLLMKYSMKSLKNALRSAADLAMVDMAEVTFIVRDLYRAHRRLASKLIRKMV